MASNINEKQTNDEHQSTSFDVFKKVVNEYNLHDDFKLIGKDKKYLQCHINDDNIETDVVDIECKHCAYVPKAGTTFQKQKWKYIAKLFAHSQTTAHAKKCNWKVSNKTIKKDVKIEITRNIPKRPLAKGQKSLLSFFGKVSEETNKQKQKMK